MKVLLLLIPLLAFASGFLLYSKNGKKEFLKFDLVQFFYAFVLAPLLFIWVRAFMYFVLREELDYNISIGQLYILDTAISLIFIVTYAFIVIHSLTKSFENKRYKDPLYNVFQDSETMHLWVSHVGMYFGVMLLFTALSMLNVAFPLDLDIKSYGFYLSLLAGFVIGLISYGAYWLSVFSETFVSTIKLFVGLFWLIHILAYVIITPSFSSAYIAYWVIFTAFTTQMLVSFFFERSDRFMAFIERFHHKEDWSAKKKEYKLAE